MKLEEEKKKHREYLAQLGQQVEESRIKKKYSVLMSEHERRVNDKDIKAYENMDTKNLYSYIPGIKNHESSV